MFINLTIYKNYAKMQEQIVHKVRKVIKFIKKNTCLPAGRL
ncbi:MAG: hypothetical protein Q7U68_03135 [Candidatus Roizmanbacteria bacterium]|nr:hypothetical protein [Candidatus Roizmanbacteria bacterium]